MLRRFKLPRLMRETGIYTLSNIINAAIPFLLLPILTRYLSTTDYGITATFQVLTGFLVSFVGLNVQGSITKKYFERETVDFGRYIANCLMLLFLSSTVLAIFIFICSSFIGAATAFPEEWLWAVLLVAFFQFINSVVLGLWQVRRKPLSFAMFQNIQSLLNLGLSLLLVVLIRWHWQGRLLAQVVAISLFGIIALACIYKMQPLKMKWNRKYISEALKFGIPLIPYSLTGWIMLSTDRIFLNKLVGLGETGIYTVAYQISMVITLLQLSFNNAWVPWIFEKIKLNDQLLNRRIVRFSYLYILLNFLAGILIFLAGPIFIKFFLGKDFYSASDFLLWLALAQAANAIHFMGVSYIFYYSKNIYLMYAAILTALIHIPVTYFMIRFNGGIGAAQALFISNLVTSLFTFFIAVRIHKMPWTLRPSIVKS